MLVILSVPGTQPVFSLPFSALLCAREESLSPLASYWVQTVGVQIAGSWGWKSHTSCVAPSP